MRIMLFSGDQDLICNHLGTEMLIDAMSWGGSKGFTSQHSKTSWIVDDYIAGYNQTERNLTYLLFHNASHMVAVDNPKATLDMINRFMNVNSNVCIFLKRSNNQDDICGRATHCSSPRKETCTTLLLGGNVDAFVCHWFCWCRWILVCQGT